jgi:hypothetical protein
MEIREMIRAAANIPVVPFWSQLIACLAMAGAKIVPEDLWDAIGKKLQADVDVVSWCDLKIDGFKVIENHVRMAAHEVWTIEQIQNFGHEPNDEKTIWAIPLNELYCLAENNDTVDDMISVYRLLFAGTEEELRTAVAAWLAS